MPLASIFQREKTNNMHYRKMPVDGLSLLFYSSHHEQNIQKIPTHSQADRHLVLPPSLSALLHQPLSCHPDSKPWSHLDSCSPMSSSLPTSSRVANPIVPIIFYCHRPSPSPLTTRALWQPPLNPSHPSQPLAARLPIQLLGPLPQ